jgi:hypothetical protein
MSKTVIYSCVTGGYDNIQRTILNSKAIPEDDVSYVLFSDQQQEETTYTVSGSSLTWSIRPPVWQHQLCQRRTARWHKVNSHVLFPQAEFVVWFDAAHRIKPVRVHREIVLPYLAEHDIAAFKHPDRTCVYQELEACKHYKKDNPTLMQQQIAGYRREGYPPFNGLVETSCLARRHTSAVVQFNQAWWGQLEHHSYRDQLSFNYTSWKLGIKYGHIPGRRDASAFCDFVRHSQR